MYGTPEDPGVIKSAVEQLFYAMEDTPNRRFLMLVRGFSWECHSLSKFVCVQVSFIEIYNETVVDLLTDPKTRPQGGLRIREQETGGVYVEGLSEKSVSCEKDIFK